MRATASLLLLPLLLVFSPLARAQESVPLLRAVPADVHFYTHGVASKTPDPASLAVGRAISSVIASGAHRDLLALATLDAPAARREQIVAAADEAFRLLGGVDWKLLVERESAFAFRLGVPMPEYMFLFRVPRESTAAQIGALKAMLTGLVRLAGVEATVQEAERTSGKITLIGFPGVPVQIALGAVGDVLVLATSANLGATAMSKLASGSDEGSILASEAARVATAGLPTARDAVEYVDLDGLLGFVGQMLGMAGSMMPNDGSNGSAIAHEMIGLGVAVLQEVNVVDSLATSIASDGRSTTTTTRFTYRPEAAQSRFARLASAQRPWTDWAKRVPKDATSFSFSTGVDPSALYDWALALVKENLSIQGDVLAKWDEIQAQMGFRLRDDLLACLSGESASVTFPALADGCALGESVTFIRLKQPDRVAAGLKRILDSASAYITSRGHKVDLQARGGLTEVRIAPLPWFHPAIGVVGDELVIASSAAAAAKIDRVTRGAEPNVLAEPRFAELGVGRRDGVAAVGYDRMESSPEQAASFLSTIGFVYTMMPDEKETRPLIIMGSLLCKFAVAMRELDFRFDQAYEVVSVPGGTTETRVVTRFR